MGYDVFIFQETRRISVLKSIMLEIYEKSGSTRNLFTVDLVRKAKNELVIVEQKSISVEAVVL